MLSFLEQSNFSKLLGQFDLLTWANDVGYADLRLNPTTKIVAFEPPEDRPPLDPDLLDLWKEGQRVSVGSDLERVAGPAFSSTKRGRIISQRIFGRILSSTAELVVNSHLHGNATAFVGVQNRGRTVKVAVSDSGVGFLEAMRYPLWQSSRPAIARMPTDHLDALLIGALLNADVFGLRRIIDRVVRGGGTVTMSSYNADLVWRLPLWMKALDAIEDNFEGSVTESLPAILGISTLPISLEQRDHGYLRIATDGLRGARVSFEVNLGATVEP